MSGRRSYDDPEGSTQVWAQRNLQGLEEQCEAFAKMLDELSKQKAEDQVGPQAFAQEIASAAGEFRSIGKDVAGWYDNYRITMQHDVDRAEGQKGSPRQERNADVGKAMRDV